MCSDYHINKPGYHSVVYLMCPDYRINKPGYHSVVYTLCVLTITNCFDNEMPGAVETLAVASTKSIKIMNIFIY